MKSSPTEKKKRTGPAMLYWYTGWSGRSVIGIVAYRNELGGESEAKVKAHLKDRAEAMGKKFTGMTKCEGPVPKWVKDSAKGGV